MAGTIKASTKKAAKNMRRLKVGDIIRVIDTTLLDAPFLKVAAIDEDEDGYENYDCEENEDDDDEDDVKDEEE